MIGAPAQGESGELDTLGSDRPDDEADEQRSSADTSSRVQRIAAASAWLTASTSTAVAPSP